MCDNVSKRCVCWTLYLQDYSSGIFQNLSHNQYQYQSKRLVPEAIQFISRVIDLSLSEKATWFISTHFKDDRSVLAQKAMKLRVDASFSVFAHLSKRSEGKADERYYIYLLIFADLQCCSRLAKCWKNTRSSTSNHQH
jgi:hypothetical protein